MEEEEEDVGKVEKQENFVRWKRTRRKRRIKDKTQNKTKKNEKRNTIA